MKGRTIGVILAVVGFITLNFGILVPSIEAYNQYIGCMGNRLGPCPFISQISLTPLFFAGLGITVVGVGILLRARGAETAWVVKP